MNEYIKKYKNSSIMVAFTILIIIIDIKKIEGFYYVAALFIIDMAYLCILNTYQQCITDNNDCIIFDTKHHGGFFNNGCLDVWHIYHLLFWIIIGQLYPNKYIYVFIYSIIWECFEHIFYKKTCNIKGFFVGRIEDIITNMIGYTIGSYLNNRNKKKKENKKCFDTNDILLLKNNLF